MTQADLEFTSQVSVAPALAAAQASQRADHGRPTPRTPLEAEGFNIGREHARHGLTPPLKHLHQDNPIRQGWELAKPIFAGRTVKATPAHRQWLALRIEAWTDGQALDDVQLNPSFLAQIDTPICPITRQPMVHTDDQAHAASVARLSPGLGYRAGNLVIVSEAAKRVAHACGHWQDALKQAQLPAGTGDLSATAWQRWAVMMSFAQALPHAQAASLPLCVLPPNRVRVVNPIQAVQVMLTLQFTASGYARRLLTLAALLPAGETRQVFQIFMHTLLARRLSVGASATGLDTRQALEDAWLDPLVNRRWQRLAWHLTAAQCEQWMLRASQRACLVGGMQWVCSEGDTSPMAPSKPASPAANGRTGPRRAYAAAASGLPKPGMTRSLGSQKLAS